MKKKKHQTRDWEDWSNAIAYVRGYKSMANKWTQLQRQKAQLKKEFQQMKTPTTHTRLLHLVKKFLRHPLKKNIAALRDAIKNK